MGRRLLVVGALGAFALLGIGGAIGWAATAGSGRVIHHGTPGAKMHDPAQMRTHMQSVHPSLSKAQIDQLVADCQKAGDSMMDGMMGAGGHTGHHGGMMG